MNVDERLIEWGRWSNDDVGLGFKKKSAFVNAFEGGRGTNTALDEPPHIREINEVLLELKQSKAKMYEAISYYYYHGTPDYLLGRKLGVSHEKANRLLQSGRDFVESRLCR